MEDMKVTNTITIEINGKLIKLSNEEARELRMELNKILGNEYVYPIYPVYPVYPEYTAPIPYISSEPIY